jgi:acyl-CoA reductase-like NAD-dependent aldehyde dehydrogenase
MDMSQASRLREDQPAAAFVAGAWRHDAPGVDLLDEALSAAVAAKRRVAALPGHERAAILRKAQQLLTARAPELAHCLTGETGKTIRETTQEAGRAAEVLGFCAEEAIRIEGRHIPLDGSAAGVGKLAIGLRFPVGVVGAIVPFNAPINLACHKVGPAFAGANTLVMKAPPQAPRTLSLLFAVFAEAGFPEGSIALLHGDAATGGALVEDRRVDFISFTGSARAGRAIKAAAGLRGCILELGGVGPTIIHEDADIETAARMCAQAGYRLAGQSCASVQNLFVHAGVFDAVRERMTDEVRALKWGDPFDPATDVGPLIDAAAADRIQSWVEEAVASGARMLCGGKREGRLIEPILLADAPPGARIVCEEAFGPVVVLHAYDDIHAVYGWIEGTGLGLNCGLFTRSHAVALEAVRAIPCAALVVNGTSTFRPDQMPYGGLRGSGYGRESPRDATRAMTQERILVLG